MVKNTINFIPCCAKVKYPLLEGVLNMADNTTVVPCLDIFI
jgi:hypothetical protein